MSLKTPILFIIFNRPNTTEQVFAEIRKAQPTKLYIAADGPRPEKKEEEGLCAEARKIIEKIDWDCEVKTLFQEKNLGILYGPHTAISWFFDKVEEGIILEDDCVPDQSFFSFCETLLEYYRDDKRIMQISGNNFQLGIERGDGSYYFSKFNHLWGWASWRRAWQLNDINMTTFPEFKKFKRIEDIWENRKAQKGWMRTFDKAYSKKLNSWDYQWSYTFWSNSGLCVLSNVNLVKNIGFGENATHTKSAETKKTNLKTGSISVIKHPSFILQDKKADDFTFNHFFATSIIKKIKNKLERFFN